MEILFRLCGKMLGMVFLSANDGKITIFQDQTKI